MLLDYLDFYRSALRGKLDGLTEDDLRRSTLPSGWSPLELLNHLTHVERRWLVWGFEGTDVGDPWADRQEGRWFVPVGLSYADLLVELDAQASVTREVVSRHELDDLGAHGDRWRGAPPASLERVLLHLLQEYARHVGQLDVVRELLDGRTGE